MTKTTAKTNPQTNENMEESMKTTHLLAGRNIAILTEKGFEEIELTSPRDALTMAGAHVHVVSPQETTVRSKTGDEWNDEFPVDRHLDEASADDYDALLIPGGVINPDKLRTNKKALEFIRAFAEAGKPIASICHGPQVLIDAGLVRDRKMTSVAAIRQDLINAGANWQDAEVIVDRGLITSRTPTDLPAFNKRMIEVFSNANGELH